MLIYKDWDITENRNTGRFKDGKPIIEAMFQTGLNDENPDKSFSPCNMDIEEVTNGVTYLRAKRGRWGEMRFGDSSHPNPFLVKIKDKGLKGVSFKYTGANGDSMTSNNGKPLCQFDNGVQIESTPYYKGVKMDIIIQDPLTAPLEYPFSVKTYGQDYVMVEEDGGLTFRGEDQNPIFIKPPFAVDANGDIGPVTIHSTGMDGNLLTFKKVVDESWFRQAVAPVRIDPDVTIEDGVDGGVIEDAWMRSGANATVNYGNDTIMWVGTATGERRSLIRVDLSSYSGSVVSAKFSIYNGGGGVALNDVYWYRVLRAWGEGDGGIAAAGESSHDAYSFPSVWTTGGCEGAGTDRSATAENDSALAIPDIDGQLIDFDCKPASVQLDMGSTFSIMIHDIVAGGARNFNTSENASNKPTFYMEYTEAAGNPAYYYAQMQNGGS